MRVLLEKWEGCAVTDRRGLIKGAASATLLGLAGCTPHSTPSTSVAVSAGTYPPKITPPNHVLAMYAAVPQERFPLPAVPIHRVAERYWRKRVDYASSHAVGTIVVETSNFHLFLVERNGAAMRYGVSLGLEGFNWSGVGVIRRKQAWPTWTPPGEMIARSPDLADWSAAKGGMPPGIENPLGARALYIYQNGRDTLYRIHGTPDTRSIGVSASSGCVRMFNQDVVDLYKRVKTGAKIVVA